MLEVNESEFCSFFSVDGIECHRVKMAGKVNQKAAENGVEIGGLKKVPCAPLLLPILVKYWITFSRESVFGAQMLKQPHTIPIQTHMATLVNFDANSLNWIQIRSIFGQIWSFSLNFSSISSQFWSLFSIINLPIWDTFFINFRSIWVPFWVNLGKKFS